MPDTTRDFPAGNYRFIPAVFQYSSGAAADSGYEIERVRFDRLVPLAEGFAQVGKYIEAAGRPLTSFCACELRSPAAFTEDGFRAFNQHYVKTLARMGAVRRHRPIRWRAAMSAPRSIRRPSRRSMRSPSPGRGRARRRASSSPAAPRRAAGQAAIPSGSCATATSARTGCKEKVRFTARRNGEPLGAFGFRLEGHHGGAGLHRARFPSRDRRRTGPPRRRCVPA